MKLSLDYRADIDGLRAVAVLAVLFYHADIRLFSGGYVGVDVFFVISGFLITNIIVREAEAGNFSILQFYERRIRRIYPALYTVILASLILGFALYDSKNFMEMSKSVIATTLFLSNILFWSEAGYFDTESTLKPMLHTWSLAVEEQFYIFFPLLVVLVIRYFKPRLKQVLASVAIISFGFSVYYTTRDASSAFYLPHFRTWELMIGSLLAVGLMPDGLSPKWMNTLSLAGMAGIMSSIFIYNDNTLFPGVSALLPTAGAALVIYGGADKTSWAGNILKLPPFVFIGKISYSLYLWHWPVILFGKYLLIRQATWLDMTILLCAAFILSVLSWKFIENPFREKDFMKKPKIFFFAGAVMAAAIILGGMAYIYKGFPGRFKEYQSKVIVGKSKWDKCIVNITNIPEKLTLCQIGKKNESPAFIVWGDSHALALATAADISAKRAGVSGYLSTVAACPPLLGIDRKNQLDCYEYNNTILKHIEDNSELNTIILAGRWALSADGKRYKTEKGGAVKLVDVSLPENKSKNNADVFTIGLQRTVQKLIELNRKVVIVMTVPEVGYNVPSSYFMALRTRRDVNQIIAPTWTEYLERNQPVIEAMKLIEEIPGVKIISPSDMLCNETICAVVKNEKPLYKDDDHLSVFGARFISNIFDATFDDIASQVK